MVMTLADLDYVVARVEVSDQGCWLWGRACMTQGYGLIAGRGGVHRLMYELACGAVPAGLQVDHLCHGWDSSCAGGVGCAHRRCCNPAHLEAVTGAENTRRGRSPSTLSASANVCARGHEFTPENTYMQMTGGVVQGRGCKACRAIRKKVYTERARIKRQRAREATHG